MFIDLDMGFICMRGCVSSYRMLNYQILNCLMSLHVDVSMCIINIPLSVVAGEDDNLVFEARVQRSTDRLSQAVYMYVGIYRHVHCTILVHCVVSK